MKRISRFMLCIVVLAFAGCEKSRWESATKTDTTAAYEEFVRDYPQSQFVPEASQRIVVKVWEEIRSLNTIAAYKSYISRYPQSQFVSEARNLLVAMEWMAASEINTVIAYEDFLKQYPESQFAGDARRMIALRNSESARIARRIKASEDAAMRRRLSSNAREGLEKLYNLTQKDLSVIAELHRRRDGRVRDSAVISRLVITGANCLDDNANWADVRQGHIVYGILKGNPEPLVTGSLRCVIVTDINRKKVLFLAVKLGIPGSQKAINKLLMTHGDKSMAEDYLNSGSSDLYEGGAAWARAHGYYIMTGMFGSHRVSWGVF